MDSPVECPLVFLDIRIGEEQIGRVVIKVWQHLFPNTVQNFLAILTGTAVGSSGRKLCYRGTRIHKVIPRFAIQCGDAVNNDGTGCDSIYGPSFENEMPYLKHDQVGLLGMTNCGQNRSGCQFYITTVENCSHIDGKNTVFGRVIRGMGVIGRVECITTHQDIPDEDIIIENCGIYQLGMPLGPEDPIGEDIFPPYPDDCPPNFINFRSLKDVACVAERVKVVGNYYYKNEQYVKANSKYKKALRYLNKYQEDSHEDLSPEEEAALTQVVIPNLLNSAACKIKLKLYDQALEDCNETLEILPNHPKALYRRGQAYHGRRDYDRAIADLTRALQLAPGDRSVVAELKACRGEVATYRETEKKSCQKYFATIPSPQSQPGTTQHANSDAMMN